MPRGPTDHDFRRYALELENRGNEGVEAVAMRVFGVGKDWAKKKAWEWRKHPVCQEELNRIQEERESQQPMSKEDKLLKNKILIDEAFINRSVDKNALEHYTKLLRIDNEMQGHTRTAENDTKKTEEGSVLIGQLMKELRAKNAKGLTSSNTEIIDIP